MSGTGTPVIPRRNSMPHHRIRPALDPRPLPSGRGRARRGDWPQFRGPNRDGISHETGLLKSWPAGGPKVLWKTPVGEGFSHVVVAGNRLFTLYGEGRNEYAVALDAGTGKQLWKVEIDSKYSSDMGNGPRSTPTVSAGTVYALSANGKLAALNARTARRSGSTTSRMNSTPRSRGGAPRPRRSSRGTSCWSTSAGPAASRSRRSTRRRARPSGPRRATRRATRRRSRSPWAACAR